MEDDPGIFKQSSINMGLARQALRFPTDDRLGILSLRQHKVEFHQMLLQPLLLIYVQFSIKQSKKTLSNIS